MKNFLLYILRSYLWTVIAITLVALFESLILDYCDDTADKTPFSSPVFAALFSGIVYPIYNLAVIIPLYKYKFTRIEIMIESICFVNIAVYIYDVIKLFVPNNLLWLRKTVGERDVYERVWWYGSSLNIVYGICITLLLCLFYIKIKKLVV